jgi:hypothetical protein
MACISGLIGGGGGFSIATCAEPWLDKPRESVQVAVTVAEPGEAPAVVRVAELPVPETEPAVDVQFATDTGTPSGLVQFAVSVTVLPGITLVGLADNDMVGGFFGGRGLTVYCAEQLASPPFLTRESVTCAVTV